VEFKVHADIHPEGQGYHCPDEGPTCPTTQWVLCAFGATNTTIDEQVAFITCLDAATGTDPEANTKTCAAAAKLDFAQITQCHGGAQVKELEKSEGAYIQGRLHEIKGVPHIEIDHKDQGLIRTYESLLKALCAKGIKAAACEKTSVLV